ncbi:hypothetical protein DRN67_00280 [Candidatus Micrarchaeota archaeon]|nr:MAG: hypothetical protein DRN67_00280 [Candidatus Micrarchaeota archaeon]
MRGKSCLNVHQLVSRICGTCSIAHMTACVECVENALNINPSSQTKLLRNLTMDGLMIRDHAMHLYLFCLPDLFGVDSVLEFEGEKKELLKKALSVKSAGNELSKWIAGRAVHAPFPMIGHYAKLPDMSRKNEILKALKTAREHSVEFIDVFADCKFSLKRDTQFVGLANESYNFIGGAIHTSQKTCIPPEHFWDHLHRIVIPYSQATGFEFEGQDYLVGALARLNLNKQNLHSRTRKTIPKYLATFPSNNIFHNNLAQAIEILNCIDSSIDAIESFDPKEEPKPELKPKASSGVGVIEAPRGTLYYKLKIDNEGKVLDANLVIPTAQNQVLMEKDVGRVVQNNLSKGKEFVQFEVEKLIRAYDPCMSCATHFLRINWL